MATVWLANRPPTAGCASAEGVVSSHLVIPARSIVARPWYGPHHVYGLFMVPARVDSEQGTAILRVSGFQESADLHKAGWVNGLDPIPGRYGKRIYLPTRVALRFLLSGHFGDLRTACNWTLEVLDQGHDSGENDLSAR